MRAFFIHLWRDSAAVRLPLLVLLATFAIGSGCGGRGGGGSLMPRDDQRQVRRQDQTLTMKQLADRYERERRALSRLKPDYFEWGFLDIRADLFASMKPRYQEYFTQVTEINFSDGRCKNDDLQWLCEFEGLEVLSLYRCPISDEGLKHLKCLSHLKSLTLSSTGISDAGLREVAYHKGLQHLYLEGTNVTSRGIEAVAQLSELRTLRVDGLPLDDEDIQILASLRNLRYLGATGTNVTERGATALRERLPQLHVHLKDPSFGGDRGVTKQGTVIKPGVAQPEELAPHQ